MNADALFRVEEGSMAKFKVGDQVQANGVLPFTKAGRVMQPNEKGIILEVTPEGYTIEFEDSMTPITGVTESEIKPA
jgi:hypothetical protein